MKNYCADTPQSACTAAEAPPNYDEFATSSGLFADVSQYSAYLPSDGAQLVTPPVTGGWLRNFYNGC